MAGVGFVVKKGKALARYLIGFVQPPSRLQSGRGPAIPFADAQAARISEVYLNAMGDELA